MCLPLVAVISVVLFISADSTNALNIIEPLTNNTNTDVLGNGNSNLVLAQKTATFENKTDLEVERPPHISDCTRQHRVRATCLEIGKRSNGDRKVLRKNIYRTGRKDIPRHEKVVASVKQQLRKKGFVISYIKVTNKMKLGREGLVSLVKGGALEKEVTLFMESQRGKKMHFHVEIYANHADKAYKSQLGSLISSLKSFV